MYPLLVLRCPPSIGWASHIIPSSRTKAVRNMRWRSFNLEPPGSSSQATVSRGVSTFPTSGRSSCSASRRHSQSLFNKWGGLAGTSGRRARRFVRTECIHPSLRKTIHFVTPSPTWSLWVRRTWDETREQNSLLPPTSFLSQELQDHLCERFHIITSIEKLSPVLACWPRLEQYKTRFVRRRWRGWMICERRQRRSVRRKKGIQPRSEFGFRPHLHSRKLAGWADQGMKPLRERGGVGRQGRVGRTLTDSEGSQVARSTPPICM
jgi:hypothetical protein